MVVFFEKIFKRFYLEGRITHREETHRGQGGGRERQREISSMYWLTPSIGAMTSAVTS